jgi:hypothetical protein
MALSDRIKNAIKSQNSDPRTNKAGNSADDKQSGPGNGDDQYDVISHTGRIWEFVRQSRRRREYEWFIDDQFYNNNQYLKYNVASRRVQAVPVEKVMDRIVINKTFQQVRGIVNFLNSEHPNVSMRPGDQADGAYLRAKKEKHQADYWYDHLRMGETAKLISLDATKYGLGWAKILWDQDALAPTTPFTMTSGETRSYQYGECMFERVDPFDIYPDPMAQRKSDMRYIVHATPRTLAELQNNKLYTNTEKLATDSRLAASNLKQFQLRQEISSGVESALSLGGKMDTVICLEVFWRYFDHYSNKWKIRVTTRTEKGLLLRDEDWGLDEFPFEYFQTDNAPLIMDSKGVIHNIREPNRALNEIVSQIHESARIMGKLNWRVPRGSNVDVITDETGQFIEYDIVPGGIPEQTNAVNLPTYIMQEVNMLVGFMEDIGGMHAAFNGKAPFSQASGDLVNTLSMGDQNNLTTMRDNYNDFWGRSFKLMFKTAKYNFTQGTRTVPSVKPDPMGEYAWEEIKPNDISTSDDVNVDTGTAMPYSIAEKQQMYMNLWKEKVITDPSTLLKLLEMPDIDNLMGDQEMDIDRQINELKDMMKGKNPNDPKNGLTPLISEDHNVHIETLDKFVKTPKFKTLKPMVQQWVMDHRQQHIDLSIQLSQIAQSMQLEPIKRSVTAMIRNTNLNELTPIERTQLFNKAAGIQSDAGQIQMRGGLYIQDPAQAEMQAQNEDIEMLQSRAVNISFGDNHQVHIETHSQVAADPNFVNQPAVVQEMITQHIKDHVQAMQIIQTEPGLVADANSGLPNPVQLHNNTHQPPQSPTPPQAPPPPIPGPPVSMDRTSGNPRPAPSTQSSISDSQGPKRIPLGNAQGNAQPKKVNIPGGRRIQPDKTYMPTGKEQPGTKIGFGPKSSSLVKRKKKGNNKVNTKKGKNK